MNQGRIWTVVSPSIGLPLIIGGAAITALLVHFAVLSHTTWYPAYWEGHHAKVSEATSSAVSALEAPAYIYEATKA